MEKRNMKRSWLAVLSTLAMLASLLFNPGTGHAQTGTSGTVVAWGSNSHGQTDVPAGLSGVTAISAGAFHNLALKNDGTVVAWGCGTYNYGQCTVPAGLSGVAAVAAGQWHSLALKSDGAVVAWGRNDSGQLNIPAGLSGVSAIAAGHDYSLAMKNDGTVVGWGYNGHGQASVPAGLSGVTAVAAGCAHSLALKSDGTIIAWGSNFFGEAAVPAGLSGVTAIAAGCDYSLALKSDGTVIGWGINNDGQTTSPAGLSSVTAISAGRWHTLALKNDGTVVAWGRNSDYQTNIPAGLNNVTAIAGGDTHSLALVQTVPVSHSPSALDDSYSTNQNTTLTVAAPGGVLSNDTDEDGDVLSANLVSGPAHGTLTLNVDGSFEYTPATNYAGQDSFTYRAIDGELASNIATVNITVSQASQYSFAGFFDPVKNPGLGPLYIFNSVKAGSALPLKFSLGGDQGLDIFAAGFPTSQPVSCVIQKLSSSMVRTVTAGSSSLSYDPATDQYTYVWKTNKRWAGTCRVLIVQLDDGSQHLAYFQFK